MNTNIIICSWTTGYNYRLINAGKIENKGIEIALSTRPIQTRDFSWDINLNFSKNSNKVKELDGESDIFELEKASWLDVQGNDQGTAHEPHPFC